MIIELKKFGKILTSRQLGKEAFLAYQPTLKKLKINEEIIVDFEGILSLSPSWADEFLIPLLKKYQSKFSIKKFDNSSVKETLSLLEDIHNIKFNLKK
jgi:hypothetical protein